MPLGEAMRMNGGKSEMVRVWRRMRFLLPILLVLPLLAACSSAKFETTTLASLNPVTYTHQSGYSLLVPESWEKTQENLAQATFVSQENAVSLNIISELGGMDYFSLTEDYDAVAAMLGKNISNTEVVEEPATSDAKKQLRRVIKGNTEDGDTVIVDIWLTEPMPSVRYYLLFSAGGNDYNNMRPVIDEMIASFKVVKSQDEIYSLLDEARDMAKETIKEQEANSAKAQNKEQEQTAQDKTKAE